MKYSISQINKVAEELRQRFTQLENKADILKSPELKALFAQIGKLGPDERAAFGQEVNALRAELEDLVNSSVNSTGDLKPIDLTAPFDINVAPNKRPSLLPTNLGSRHPLMTELDRVLNIFMKMGFTTMEARQIDDDFHMFGSLNFPAEHPARDDYDTFMTTETDSTNKPFIAPAHVSTTQNRLQKKFKAKLANDQPISVVYYGRSFRNEDKDARHEHTFYQVEISYIDKNINVGNLISTFRTFLEAYYEQKIDIKSQPFYFPFTEPSLELALGCPFCQKKGCSICGYSGWIELLGMGSIHPNVLKAGGIDPAIYSGFAGGMGLDRLVMMKYDIEDVRNFHSANLEFLRQFP